MPTRDIKTRFKLEGEQAYRKAMTDAANSIKVLNSEQRLAAAEFEASGDAQQYASEKARILKEQIEHQKKAVEAAEKAIADLTKNGVQPSSKEFQNWKTKLNNAKTSLAKMESKLNDAEKELKEQTGELGKAKDAMSQAETNVKSLTEEEKLAEAQYKATGDRTSYMTARVRIAKDKIAEQEKAVAAAETAIKSLTENGVDPNSEEMVEWKSKLVTAKTKLAEMKTQLNQTERELKEQTTEVSNAKTEYENAESKIKSLTAEEKLAEAQFKATGDRQSYMTARTRILNEKIAAQQEAVTAAETAIKSLTENGVDPNSEEVQKWRDKLVTAKLGLQNLQNRLDRVGTEMDEETEAFGDATTGAGNLREAIENVGKDVDFQNVISSIDDITGHMEDVVKAAAKTAKAVWDMGVDAATWADDIATAAADAQVDVETYQSWLYASKFIDTNVSDIVASFQDITKKLKEGDDDYEATLARFGIASRTSANEIRGSQDIFWDAIDYLNSIKDSTDLAGKATLLFGNDWRKLNPLIEAGSKGYQDMADEGMAIAVVSEKNVGALGEFDDQMQQLTSQLDKLKYDALAALAPTFKKIAEAMSTAVASLNEFVQSEEGQGALKALNEAVSGLIDSFLGEDGGKGSFEAIVTAAKDAVNNFTKAMDWLNDNGETAATAVKTLVGAWAGLKITKGVLEFMTILKATPLAKLTAIFGGGAGSAAAGAATGAASASGGGLVGGLIAKATGVASEAAGAVAIPAAVVTAAMLPAVLADNLNRAQINERLQNIKDSALAAAENMGKEAEAAVNVINLAIDALGESETKLNVLGEKVLGDVRQIDEAMKQAEELNNQNKQEGGSGIVSNKTAAMLYEANTNGTDPGTMDTLAREVVAESLGYLEDGPTEETTEDISDTLSNSLDEITAMKEALIDAPGENIEALYALLDKLVDSKVYDLMGTDTQAEIGRYYLPNNGFGVGSTSQFEDAQDLLDTISSDLDYVWKEYVENGNQMPAGFAQGIAENTDAVTDASTDMADSAIEAAQSTLDINSPSKVFETIGNNTAVGLANGIYAGADSAITAAQWLAKQVTEIMQDALQIHSPSKVFERLGEFTGLGYAEGIENSARRVSQAVSSMMGATSQRPIASIGGVSYGGLSDAQKAGHVAGESGENPDMVHVTLVLDEEILGDVMAPIVNDKIGARINAVRR